MGKNNLNNSSPTIRVVVVGDRDVGKSALVVRLLTKRFIGEYVSGQELTYQQEVTLSGNKVTAEICDALVKKDQPDYLKQLSTNTDAYMLVYSVCNRESFNYARQLAGELKTFYRIASPNEDVPFLLVGSKSDLDHFREVKRSEGESFAKSLSLCHFIESSAAESYSDVEQAFRIVFQLARAHTSTSPTPSANGSTSRLLRKNSISQMAQLIRDHYRKGHLSPHTRTNSLERGLSLFKNNAPSCDGGYPLSPDVAARRKARKHLTLAGYTPTYSSLSSGKPKLSSKCLSLSTLTEDPVTEELDSHFPGKPEARPKPGRPKSVENELPSYLTDETCSNDDCSCKLQVDANKMSVSSDETIESSDVSAPEEDAFSSESSNSTTVSPRETPTTEQTSELTDKYRNSTTSPKRLSINKKNLQIDVLSADKVADSELSGRFSPKSAPLVQSTSNHKFRYFPNGVNDNHHLSQNSWSALTTSTVPVSPLLNHRQRQKIKSPKEDKKSPAQSFLRQFFKGNLNGSSNNRSFGSDQSFTASLSMASSEPSLLNDRSSNSLSGNLGESGPIYFHASSTSLSSIISNDPCDINSLGTSSAPTSPHIRKSSKKSRRSSIREAVGGLMRKRKQSVSIETLKQNTNKERIL